MTRRTAASLTLSALLLHILGCSESETPLEQARREKTAVVAVVPFAGPFFYQSQAESTGPDAEIAKRIVGKTGSEIRLVFGARTYSNIISAVANNEALFAVSAIAVTEERRQLVDFSDPYYELQIGLITNPSNKPLDSPNPQILSTFRIGIRDGSVVQDVVEEKFPGATIVPHDNLDSAVLALRRKELDAVIDDRVMAAFSLDTVTGASVLELVPGVIASVPVAVAVPKGDAELLRLVNQVIAEVKDSTYQKWFDSHLQDRLAKIEMRYTDRKQREQQEREPRNITIRISKDADYDIDIYRLANLSFTFSGGGRTYTSSRIDFRGPVAYSSISVPPGSYRAEIVKAGFRANVNIVPTHPKNLTISIRLKLEGPPAISIR